MSGVRRSSGVRWFLAAAVLWAIVAVPAGHAQVAPPASVNPYNEALLHMTPEQRTAKLSSFLGLWCIGTNPFYMGTTKSGPAKGYAYWSLTCAGAQSYMIQMSPDGQGAAVDCRVLKAQGQGRECYKTF